MAKQAVEHEGLGWIYQCVSESLKDERGPKLRVWMRLPGEGLACKEMRAQDQAPRKALARRMSLHAIHHNMQLPTLLICLLAVFPRRFESAMEQGLYFF